MDQIGHAKSMQATVEAGKAAATKTTCPAQKLVKELFWIWQLLEPMHVRKIQRHLCRWDYPLHVSTQSWR